MQNMSKVFIRFILLFFIIFLNISSAKNRNITLQLSWFNQFQFAGYYMAKEKGFYENLGLDVTIKAFEFGLDIPSDISKEKYDFAIGRETLILEKIKNKEIVALYALFQASPLILVSTKESGIKSISDFENKRIMTTIDDASEVSLKAMITSQKIDIKNLHFIMHTHNINDLINKNTEVISAYLSKSPFHLQKMNIPYNIFAPKDYGFDMYSDLLYTSKSKIKNDLDSVLNFKHASLKGWEYAYSNIEETVDLILRKYNTQNLTREELIFEAKELKKLSYYKTKHLGDMNLAKLQRSYDLYNVMGLVENKINIQEFLYLENDMQKLMRDLKETLNKYIQLPYIYFFISLFFLLILLIVFKQIKLHLVTQRLKENEIKLRELSEKDYLTKLYNRRYFELITKEYISLSNREFQDISILLFDIDDFKSINDNYGHQFGDFILKSLANILNEYKRDSDVVARYGGEEFVILLPNTSIHGAKTYCERLRKHIENRVFEHENIKINITVSMGLTIFETNESLSLALNRADKGMYDAKSKGKNQLSIKL